MYQNRILTYEGLHRRIGATITEAGFSGNNRVKCDYYKGNICIDIYKLNNKALQVYAWNGIGKIFDILIFTQEDLPKLTNELNNLKKR